MIRRMRLLVSLSFLFVMVINLISGMHLHVGVEGMSGVHSSHGVHQEQTHEHGHEHSADHHSHEAESDVSLFELGTSSGKLLPFLILLLVAVLGLITSTRVAWVTTLTTRIPSQRPRWRPPLRGPPITVS